MLINQSISNSKDFKEVKRTINIIGFNVNSDLETFDIYYRIQYTKDGVDVSNLFNQKLPEWHIDNTTNMVVKDENFKPVLNRYYVEEKDSDGKILNESERYFKMPAFDYLLKLLLKTPVKLEDTLQGYIIAEDEDGRFNY